jgi:hypothetical protein
VIADVCPWCAGGSRHSDWRPYCSAGCEYNGALNAVLADGEAAGRAAERAAVVAWLRANVAQRVLSLADTIACIERGDHRHKGEP